MIRVLNCYIMFLELNVSFFLGLCVVFLFFHETIQISDYYRCGLWSMVSSFASAMQYL